MGFFDGLKRTFSIGGCRIGLVTDATVVEQGDLVSGSVGLIGHNYLVEGDEVLIELKEFWRERRGTGKNRRTVTVYATRAQKKLLGAFSLEVGTTKRLPFSLRLPTNCRLTTSGTGWCLLVTLDVPRAIDPTHKVLLKVLPHKSFRAIQTALASQGGFRDKPRSTRWSKSSSEVRFVMRPPKSLGKELDDIRLHLSHNRAGGVKGKLKFDLQEKKLTDYFKALVGKDVKAVPFALTADQIFSANGSIDEKGIYAKFKQAMHGVLKERRGIRG